MLADLKKQYESKGVYFISLTVDKDDTQSKVTAWLKKAGTPELTAGSASQQATAKLHKLGGQEPGPVPANVFISPDGRVSQVVIGAVGHDELEQAVKAITPN